GGAIAQLLCLQHPERALSLTSIMSTTHRPGVPLAQPAATAHLLAPRPKDREGFIEGMIAFDRARAGARAPFEEERARTAAGRVYERGWSAAGTARQLAAFICTPSRHEELGRLRLPSLVIHGALDPLIPVEHGRDTAACIPGA